MDPFTYIFTVHDSSYTSDSRVKGKARAYLCSMLMDPAASVFFKSGGRQKADMKGFDEFKKT